MEITFKYNGKVITTPNLEKKLKRMKIQLSDIEIIEIPIKKSSNDGIEDYMKDKELVVIRSTQDNFRRIWYIPKGTRPPLEKLFEKVIWNGKTGIKEITNEYIKTMYYEN